jgi:hypothetical protein
MQFTRSVFGAASTAAFLSCLVMPQRVNAQDSTHPV